MRIFILTLLLWAAGCGVKGKPLPPLTTPPIGRGNPNFSKATEKVKLKNKTTGAKDDFEEPSDFNEDRDK